MLQVAAGKEPAATTARGNAAAVGGAGDGPKFARLVAEVLGKGSQAAGSGRPGGKTLPHADARARAAHGAADALSAPLAALIAQLAGTTGQPLHGKSAQALLHGQPLSMAAIVKAARAALATRQGNVTGGRADHEKTGASAAGSGGKAGSGGAVHTSARAELHLLEQAVLRHAHAERSGPAANHGDAAHVASSSAANSPSQQARTVGQAHASNGNAASQGAANSQYVRLVPEAFFAAASSGARASGRTAKGAPDASSAAHEPGHAGPAGGTTLVHAGGSESAAQAAGMRRAIQSLASVAGQARDAGNAAAEASPAPHHASASAPVHALHHHGADGSTGAVWNGGSIATVATHGATPTTQGPARLRPQAGAQQFGDALGKHLGVMINHGNQNAVLHLDPPQLGTVQVHLNAHQNNVSAWFVSANADVRQALEAGMPALRQALAQQGVSLSGSFVADQGRQQPFDQRPGGRHRPGPAALPEDGELPLARHDAGPRASQPALRNLSVYV